MLEELKKQVCEANLELVARGIVIYTWGNVSGVDREKNMVVIKPSGVDYANMNPDDMVVVDINTGKVIEGKWNPSSDTATHLELYKKYKDIGGVVHTHSVNAAAFAQAGVPIPALGTTHADYFYGDIPCTRPLEENEVVNNYELNTGKVIIETIDRLGLNPMDMPGIIVNNHGPFTWGSSSAEAVFNAVVLERIAEIATKTLMLNPNASMHKYILDKHYYRKHGPNAYYGQKK